MISAQARQFAIAKSNWKVPIQTWPTYSAVIRLMESTYVWKGLKKHVTFSQTVILLIHRSQNLLVMWTRINRYTGKRARNSSLLAVLWTRWASAGRDDTSQRINGLRGSQSKPAASAWHLCTCKSTEISQAMRWVMDRVLSSVPFNNACKANGGNYRERERTECSLLGICADFRGAVYPKRYSADSVEI